MFPDCIQNIKGNVNLGYILIAWYFFQKCPFTQKKKNNNNKKKIRVSIYMSLCVNYF